MAQLYAHSCLLLRLSDSSIKQSDWQNNSGLQRSGCGPAAAPLTAVKSILEFTNCAQHKPQPLETTSEKRKHPFGKIRRKSSLTRCRNSLHFCTKFLSDVPPPLSPSFPRNSLVPAFSGLDSREARALSELLFCLAGRKNKTPGLVATRHCFLVHSRYAIRLRFVPVKSGVFLHAAVPPSSQESEVSAREKEGRAHPPERCASTTAPFIGVQEA